MDGMFMDGTLWSSESSFTAEKQFSRLVVLNRLINVELWMKFNECSLFV